MGGQIFISYRIDDSQASAGRLYDRLHSHLASNRSSPSKMRSIKPNTIVRSRISSLSKQLLGRNSVATFGIRR